MSFQINEEILLRIIKKGVNLFPRYRSMYIDKLARRMIFRMK